MLQCHVPVTVFIVKFVTATAVVGEVGVGSVFTFTNLVVCYAHGVRIVCGAVWTGTGILMVVYKPPEDTAVPEEEKNEFLLSDSDSLLPITL